MFMDVVGSTALGETTDPESMRRVMTRYFDEIRSIVERHGGSVEKYIGDAVMAVFGVPVVHEDDALRAVRAAIDTRERLAVLGAEIQSERGMAVSWRTGINTGEVVAGDAGAGQRFVTGDTVNVAARLEQAAQSGDVLIGAETFLLVRDAAVVQPTSPITAKGKSSPVAAYRLIEAANVAAGPPRRLDSPMVGRQRQQRQLSESYQQVVDERLCYLFTVLGAAGVGKSRLISEFLVTQATDATILHGRCLSYGEGITFWPIAQAVRQAAGLTEDDDDETVARRIGALMREDPVRPQVVERLGGVLGRFGAKGVAEETFWAVRTLLQALAGERPVVLVLDDLHWAEPTLLDLIEHVSELVRGVPLMIICVARQELLDVRPGWGGGKSYATTLTLEPLNEAESHQLLANLLGETEPVRELKATISAAAEGNPLFVEEMVGMLLDAGQLNRVNGGWVVAGNIAAVTVPPTIQALLAARLDGLPAAERAVIARGAVEGKVFHRGAVAELVPQEVRESVPLHLRSLSRKELVRPDRSDFAGDEAFRFRHLLVRDAAYAQIPKESRAQLHERFADWLKQMAGEHVAQYDELLGYHYEQAFRYRTQLGPVDEDARRLAGLAAWHFARSGQRALDRGDVAAAQKLLGRAAELPHEDEPLRTRARTELGLALATSGDLRAADELLAQIIERARDTGDELGAAYAEVVRVETQSSLATATGEEIIGRIEQLLPVFEQYGDRRAGDRASFELARNHFFAGQITLGEGILAARLAQYPRSPAEDTLSEWLPAYWAWGRTPVAEAAERLSDMLASPKSRSMEAMALLGLGIVRGLTGAFDDARELFQRAITIREELGHAVSALAERGLLLGELEMHAQDYTEAERVLRIAHEGLETAGERGYHSTVVAALASACAFLGRFDDAERYAILARQMVSADDVATHSQSLRALASALAGRHQFEAAETRAMEGLAILIRTDYIAETGTSYAQLAEILLSAGRRSEAIGALDAALANFEAKGASVLADRARRRIAELKGSAG